MIHQFAGAAVPVAPSARRWRALLKNLGVDGAGAEATRVLRASKRLVLGTHEILARSPAYVIRRDLHLHRIARAEQRERRPGCAVCAPLSPGAMSDDGIRSA